MHLKDSENEEKDGCLVQNAFRGCDVERAVDYKQKNSSRMKLHAHMA